MGLGKKFLFNYRIIIRLFGAPTTVGFTRGVRHELESRTTCLESLGIPHKIRNLALESGIFSQINIRKFPIISGYFNSARLTLLLGGTFCHTRDRVTNGKKLSRAVAIVRGVLSRI